LSVRLEALAPLLPGRSALPLAAGLEFLRAIEGADPSPFDALIGPLPPPEAPERDVRERPWSPSRLAALGACPQRYFFRHGLRVEGGDDPAEAHVLDAAAIGLAVHAVLAEIDRDPSATDRAVRLRRAWERETAPIASRLEALYPGLWELLGG